MSNSKKLKTVDWYIEVPEESAAKFQNKSIKSSIFSVEFMKVKTLWKLNYNLNDRGTDEFAVFLKMCSKPDDIRFNCKLETSIVGSSFSSLTFVDKSVWGYDIPRSNKNIEPTIGSSWGETLMKSEILRKKRSELCINGKVHLRVNLLATDLTEEQQLELQKHEKPLAGMEDLEIVFTPTFCKSDSIFDVIKSSDSDILIKTDDGMVLKAHKSVLSEKSTVFESMFTIDMEEAASQSVDIIDFKGPVMDELLRFIYFGNVKNIKQVDVELFKAAKVYEIAELPEICLKSITAGVNHENVIDIVQFADLYGLGELFQNCCVKIRELRHQKFIQKRLDDLEMKLQIKVLNKIITQMESLEIHVELEACGLD